MQTETIVAKIFPDKLYFPDFPIIQYWDLMRSETWAALSSLSNILMEKRGFWSNFTSCQDDGWQYKDFTLYKVVTVYLSHSVEFKISSIFLVSRTWQFIEQQNIGNEKKICARKTKLPYNNCFSANMKIYFVY